jgi:SAM-dependent methyltransferase
VYDRIDLTPEWQSFEREFVTSDTEDNARVHFDVGDSSISVEVSSVILRSLTDGKVIKPGVAGGAGLPGGAVSTTSDREVPLGDVRFGSFRRVTPISQDFGYERGRPVDRYYIENFLESCAADVRGRVLEVGDRTYTRRFGGDRVVVSDMLHVVAGEPEATIIGDLASADHIPSDTFDCVILTQTLQLIYDFHAAIRTIHRILKPGGTLLATFPGISQTYDTEWGGHWCWAFTGVSARRMFGDVFGKPNPKVETFGNVLAAVCFLHGLSVEEMTAKELDYHEPGYAITVAVRATKA